MNEDISFLLTQAYAELKAMQLIIAKPLHGDDFDKLRESIQVLRDIADDMDEWVGL